MNYYAKVNENEICTEIVSTKKDLKGIRGFIEIPDYNESLIYRKWLGDQWSSERYEPSIESQFQDKVKELSEQLDEMVKKNEVLSDALAELTELLLLEKDIPKEEI